MEEKGLKLMKTAAVSPAIVWWGKGTARQAVETRPRRLLLPRNDGPRDSMSGTFAISSRVCSSGVARGRPELPHCPPTRERSLPFAPWLLPPLALFALPSSPRRGVSPHLSFTRPLPQRSVTHTHMFCLELQIQSAHEEFSKVLTMSGSLLWEAQQTRFGLNGLCPNSCCHPLLLWCWRYSSQPGLSMLGALFSRTFLSMLSWSLQSYAQRRPRCRPHLGFPCFPLFSNNGRIASSRMQLSSCVP
mmetsp:Transcript_39333/g.84978  ORF Transcript_39333/g.84978 Transcript_39333/m.84978 type:complete len:245 (-) Transcript_39333:743-1477(-)